MGYLRSSDAMPPACRRRPSEQDTIDVHRWTERAIDACSRLNVWLKGALSTNPLLSETECTFQPGACISKPFSYAGRRSHLVIQPFVTKMCHILAHNQPAVRASRYFTTRPIGIVYIVCTRQYRTGPSKVSSNQARHPGAHPARRDQEEARRAEVRGVY